MGKSHSDVWENTDMNWPSDILSLTAYDSSQSNPKSADVGAE